ncbi:MAG: type II secretion system protein [Planctomycetia bacterium]|nr:type II secretion system protein [Planctomycetia bacterium]
MRRYSTSSRPGFTLTELMVSLALIVFIMSIMATAFGAASKVVTDLRAANDLAERLRGAMTLMRNDLKNQHLDNTARRLSDTTWPPSAANNQGFFRIYQVGRPIDIGPAGADQTSIMTSAALHFTTKLSGLYSTDFFSTDLQSRILPTTPVRENQLVSITGNQQANVEMERSYQRTQGTEFRSQWAEVAWWLAPQNGIFTTPDAASGSPAQQLYTLRRRQRLLYDRATPSQVSLPWVALTDPSMRRQHRDVSIAPYNLTALAGTDFKVNTPSDVTVPAMRFGSPTIPANLVPPNSPSPATSLPLSNVYAGLPLNPDDPYGSGMDINDDVPDIVLGDVLSMDIRILLDSKKAFIDLGHPDVQIYRTGNPAFNPGTHPRGLYVFDTWTRQNFGQLDYTNPESQPLERWRTPGTYSCVPLYRQVDGTGNYIGSPILIRAIQVTLRIWDEKSNFTRQVTMIQEL